MPLVPHDISMHKKAYEDLDYTIFKELKRDGVVS